MKRSNSYVIGKSHKHGRVYTAVVIERPAWKIVYDSGLGFNKKGKAACEAWIRNHETL